MKLQFDQTGQRKYKTGIERGVLFVVDDNGAYKKGVAFNGLINFNHSPEGAEENDFYADNIKYLTIRSAENFKASMTAYYTPEEFDECDGTKTLVPGVLIRGQSRRLFGFAYISKIGNDTVGDNYGEILHIIYGCSVNPSEETHETINDSPAPQELSYDVSSNPIPVEGYKAISCIEIDSTKVSTQQWKQVIDAIYGTDNTYKKTTDVAIDPNKTYYTRSATEPYVYTEVETPDVADIGNYYEVDVAGKDSKILLPADIIAMFPVTSG